MAWSWSPLKLGVDSFRKRKYNDCRRLVMDDYNEYPLMTVRELARKAGVSEQYIRQVMREGKIAGAHKLGDTWVCPRPARAFFPPCRAYRL